jgi:hypothetical protein
MINSLPNQSKSQDTVDQPTMTRRPFDIPSQIVLGQAYSNSIRDQNNEQQDSEFVLGKPSATNDDAHSLVLYEQLTSDLGDLLNRTDISDCYLDVKGKP